MEAPAFITQVVCPQAPKPEKPEKPDKPDFSGDGPKGGPHHRRRLGDKGDDKFMKKVEEAPAPPPCYTVQARLRRSLIDLALFRACMQRITWRLLHRCAIRVCFAQKSICVRIGVLQFVDKLLPCSPSP